MNLPKPIPATETKARLSTLWMFYLFTDLDDTFHMVIEMAALCFIIWSAWRWRNPFPQQSAIAQEVSS